MNIDWISLLIGGILGAFFSWVITKIYYEKAKKDNNRNAEKKDINDEKTTEKSLKN